MEIPKVQAGQRLCIAGSEVLSLVRMREAHCDGRQEADYVVIDLTVWKAPYVYT
jgi:hypothetical protein